MKVPEHSKFILTGFSGNHVGYVLAAFSFLLVPVHFYTSGEATGVVCIISFVVLLIALGLSFITLRRTVHRFRPAAFALFAVGVHKLIAHWF